MPFGDLTSSLLGVSQNIIATVPERSDVLTIVVDQAETGRFSFATHNEIHLIGTLDRHGHGEYIACRGVLVAVAADITSALLVVGNVEVINGDGVNGVNWVNGIDGIDWVNGINGVNGGDICDKVAIEAIDLGRSIDSEVLEISVLVRVVVRCQCNGRVFCLSNDGVVVGCVISVSPVGLKFDVKGLSSLHVNTRGMGIVVPLERVPFVSTVMSQPEFLILDGIFVIAETITDVLRVVGVGANVDHLIHIGADRDVLGVQLRSCDLEGGVVR